MTRRRKIRGTLPPRTGVASVDNELGKGQILFFSENDLYPSQRISRLRPRVSQLITGQSSKVGSTNQRVSPLQY